MPRLRARENKKPDKDRIANFCPFKEIKKKKKQWKATRKCAKEKRNK